MNNQQEPLGVGTKIVIQHGRWVVYLSVDYWDERGDDNPIRTVWHRISEFASAEAAMVAARWYECGADGSIPRNRMESSGDDAN